MQHSEDAEAPKRKPSPWRYDDSLTVDDVVKAILPQIVFAAMNGKLAEPAKARLSLRAAIVAHDFATAYLYVRLNARNPRDESDDEGGAT